MITMMVLLTVLVATPLPMQTGLSDQAPVRLGVPLLDADPHVVESPARVIVPNPTIRKPDPVLAWNTATLEAIRAERSTPLAASRNLAIVHAAIYDAVNSIAPTHSRYRIQVTNLAHASPDVAAAVAAHRVLVSLYPNQVDRFDEVLDRCLDTISDGAAKQAGLKLGQLVAERMLAWRSKDTVARPAVQSTARAPGQWVPTPPDYRPALQPNWSKVPCFCMKSSTQFRPPPPPALTSQAYARSLNEVKAIGATLSSVRSADQTEIAWFWSDGEGTVTPPGHWNQIAQTVARGRGTSLQENARLFALLNLTLADAAILCWDSKYHYDLWRPVTAIRQADPDWTSLVPTPPFPTYTSGHSSFSSSAAAVLAHFFGTDAIAFSSRSDVLPGVVRRYPSFSAAAREAGLSRIYGGIHFDFDNEAGQASGRALAEYVTSHYLLAQPKE